VTARNMPAFFAAQELHAAVRSIMAAHSPLARPLTAKAINVLLPPNQRRDERTIRYHMQRIREAEIDCRYGNSLPESDAA
jgi:repressor of nif and glnA expression